MFRLVAGLHQRHHLRGIFEGGRRGGDKWTACTYYVHTYVSLMQSTTSPPRSDHSPPEPSPPSIITSEQENTATVANLPTTRLLFDQRTFPPSLKNRANICACIHSPWERTLGEGGLVPLHTRNSSPSPERLFRRFERTYKQYRKSRLRSPPGGGEGGATLFADFFHNGGETTNGSDIFGKIS